MAACGFKHGFQLRTPFAMKISSFSTVILTARGAERLCLTIGTVEKGNDGSPLATYEGTSAVARVGFYLCEAPRAGGRKATTFALSAT